MTKYQFALKVGDVSDARTKALAVTQGLATGGSQKDVRRPLRGIQVKGDTFATMSVVTAGGSLIQLKNSSAPSDSDGVGESGHTSNFILTSSSEERSEKFQSISTFGAAYGFFFGEQPRFVSYQAVLMNTADFQWELEWWHNYDNVLRGTKLVENMARVYLYYDEVTVEGYIIRAQTQKVANTPYEVALNFTMWVTNVQSVQTPGATMDARKDSGVAPVTSGVLSTTTAVRAANIKAYKDRRDAKGLLSTLRAGLTAAQNFTGGVGAAIDDAKNFLYGRTLVIPAGFAGSERYSGQANFASLDAATGAQLQGLLRDVTKGSVTIRLPAPMVLPEQRRNTEYHDNIDEYVNRTDISLRLFHASATLLTGAKVDRQRDAVLAAEAMFKANGINVTNQTGTGTDVIRDFMARTVFGVVSFVAMEGTAATTTEKRAAIKAEKKRKFEEAKEDAAAEQLAIEDRQDAARARRDKELADAWDAQVP